MIAELAVTEVVFRGNGEPRLVQSVQPCFHVLRRNPQSAIRKRLRASVELLEICRNGFGRGLKQTPQFRFDVDFPFRAELCFGITRRRAVYSSLRRFNALSASALGDLPEQLGKKGIELTNLEAIFRSAELHFSLFVRAWRGEDSREAAGRRAQLARAFRSREWSARADALRAYVSRPVLSLGQKLSETPSSRNSSG